MILMIECNSQDIPMFKKAIHDYASRVASLDDLPPVIAAAIRQHTTAAAIQSLLVLPPQSYPLYRARRWRILPFGWRVTPERVLVFTPEALFVAEPDAAGHVAMRAVPLADVLACDMTVNLLYGCLGLHWIVDGQVAVQRLEFSTVRLHLIRAALDTWRAGLPHPAGDAAPGISLAGLPLKFRNYLRTALLPGEQVRAACFQPEISLGGGWFQPRLTPNRTVALTDWHVIVLAEDGSRPVANYGLITQIFPWDKVRGLDLGPSTGAPGTGTPGTGAPGTDGLVEATLVLGLGEARHRQRFLLGRAVADTLRLAFDTQADRTVVVGS